MKSVNQRYERETIVLNSRFIAILIPFKDEDDIKKVIDDVKKEYKKARHYCYAYRTKTKTKSNDDGEPSGTAGRPLLELLYKKDLINVALIVVRYFGGSKLGASRLLRTYVSSGVNVINDAELIEVDL